MQVRDLIVRLDAISKTIQRFVPPDASLADLVVRNEADQYEVDVDMGDSFDMAEKYRDALATALNEDGIEWTMQERGRRRDDAHGAFIFITPTFVIRAVNFSQWAHQLGMTTVGPTDSGDPDIERFINASEAGTAEDL